MYKSLAIPEPKIMTIKMFIEFPPILETYFTFTLPQLFSLETAVSKAYNI